MLHPNLGSANDPMASWQVDTDEIGDVMRFFERRLSDAEDSESLSRRLGLLWKKLASTPRFARLLVEYTQLRVSSSTASDTSRHDEPRLVGRMLAALGRTSFRRETVQRVTFAEEDPLYDRWVDG